MSMLTIEQQMRIVANEIQMYEDILSDTKVFDERTLELLNNELNNKKQELLDLGKLKNKEIKLGLSKDKKDNNTEGTNKYDKKNEYLIDMDKIGEFLPHITEPILKNRFLVHFPKEFGIKSDDVISIDRYAEMLNIVIRDNVNAPILKLLKFYRVSSGKDIVLTVLGPNCDPIYEEVFKDVLLESICDNGFNYEERSTHNINLKFSFKTNDYVTASKE